MALRRLVPVLALAAMLFDIGAPDAGALGLSPAPSGSPVVAPSGPPAPASPSTEVRWRPVDGVLGGAIPMLSVGTTTPITWDGRFWALETYADATPPDGAAGSATWHDAGVWESVDGASWVRHPLPAAMIGQLTLLPWRRGIAIIEEVRTRSAGVRWRFRVWMSTDGARWHRSGGLDLRATGALRGCGFGRTAVTTAGDHLVAVADCVLFVGAGGDIGPGYRSQASALVASATPIPATIPTYTWTSSDGRSWTRHRVDVRSGHRVNDPWLSEVRAVGDGMAVLTGERQRRLLWSTDGVRFQTVADLPDARNPVDDVDATVDGRGTPRTWWILMDDVSAAQPGHGAPGAVSRLAPDGTWQVTLRTVWPEQVDIAADGDRLVVVEAAQAGTGAARGVEVRTSTSIDQGSTWATSTDPTRIDECEPGVALSSTAAVLACPGPDAAVLLHATLWAGP